MSNILDGILNKQCVIEMENNITISGTVMSYDEMVMKVKRNMNTSYVFLSKIIKISDGEPEVIKENIDDFIKRETTQPKKEMSAENLKKIHTNFF